MTDTPQTDETWVLMSTDVFNNARSIGTIRLWNEAIHATPDQMETNPDIHHHLNAGGIIIIHCDNQR